LRQVITVPARPKAWGLAAWTLRSWVRIPLKAWMFVPVFLCCAVLWRQMPWVPTRRADQKVVPNVELIHIFRGNSELKHVTRPNP